MAYAALGLGAMGLLYPVLRGFVTTLAARHRARAQDLRRRVRGAGQHRPAVHRPVRPGAGDPGRHRHGGPRAGARTARGRSYARCCGQRWPASERRDRPADHAPGPCAPARSRAGSSEVRWPAASWAGWGWAICCGCSPRQRRARIRRRCPLLEAYLDRRFPDWQAEAAAPPEPSGGAMDERTALEILGLAAGCRGGRDQGGAPQS